MSTTPRPPQIIPYLFYRDVPAALDFLTRAFGFKEEMRVGTPSGGTHGEASFQGQLVMMGQGADERSLKTPKAVGAATMGVFVYLDDADKH
jgi:PhnB protein